ncbi:Guanine nucleotide-binding protein-like 1, partial [Pseudolycoriella hygida]
PKYWQQEIVILIVRPSNTRSSSVIVDHIRNQHLTVLIIILHLVRVQQVDYTIVFAQSNAVSSNRQLEHFFPLGNISYNADSDNETERVGDAANGEAVQKINYQSSSSDGRGTKNRYALQFYKEADERLQEMRRDALKPLKFVDKKSLEIGTNDFTGHKFPKRPEWSYAMSKEQLDRNENSFFTKYVSIIEKWHRSENKILSYFELNLETWRQLWRVLEISDIVLIIVDIRYPTLMFPPSLYEYVTKDLKKKMILVMNKVDLVESKVVLAWKKYFEEVYPDLAVVLFTSYPGYCLRNTSGMNEGLKVRRRRGKMKMAFEGAQQVYEICKDIVKDAVDLSSWETKISEELKQFHESDEDIEGPTYKHVHDDNTFNFEEHVLYKNGVLTIGCVGFPNVGKSSLMNALMGKKVVSVSKTPGHTKHFQTIFLTNTVRLCDCPGLVFPTSTPRPFQVLMGSYPIAQLRVPMAPVQYLAERVDLKTLLNLTHPSGKDDNVWSTVDICEAWAIKRGFLTAKAARPDTNRAANSILRMALEGQITLFTLPPKFFDKEEFWSNHEELPMIEEVQAFGKLDESLDNTISTMVYSEEENSSDDDESTDDKNLPALENAFAILNAE